MNNKRQRNMLFTILLLVMAWLIPQWGWAQETSRLSVGNGSTDKPYEISTAAELAWFRDYVNGVIVDEGEAPGTVHLSASAMLTEDIDLKNYCYAAGDGKELLSWIPIGNAQNRWKGKMYGQKHTISNLYIKSAQDYVGLFGYIENAIIQDIIFNNAQVENVSETGKETQYTGTLAGYVRYAYNNIYVIKGIRTTTDCKVTGQTSTGGIIGYTKINLERCENHSSVKGTGGVGGIAGKCEGFLAEAINVKYCANYGTVENDKNRIGGIIGLGENIIIMKKKYMQPSMAVAELENSTLLLAGSNPPKNYDSIRFTEGECDDPA